MFTRSLKKPEPLLVLVLRIGSQITYTPECMCQITRPVFPKMTTRKSLKKTQLNINDHGNIRVDNNYGMNYETRQGQTTNKYRRRS